MEQLYGCLDDDAISERFLYGVEDGILEVLVLVLSGELSDETGFSRLAECEIGRWLQWEDVEHFIFCNLTLLL